MSGQARISRKKASSRDGQAGDAISGWESHCPDVAERLGFLAVTDQNSTMTKDEIFDSLVESAFDFMGYALDTVADKPKYALMSLASGIELIFKARLVCEGAQWVASEPTEASLERFKQGRIKTVGFDLARKRIEALSGTSIDKAACNAFFVVASHRNRVVHFFHADLDKLRAQVASDIYVAWHFLYKLMTGQWQSYFDSHQNTMRALGTRLQGLKPLLQAVFYRVVSGSADTESLAQCPCCDFRALDPTTKGGPYVGAICRVCGYQALSHRAVKHGEEVFCGSCGECNGIQTVIDTGLCFKCRDCEETFSGYTTCEFCGEHWVGVSGDFGDYLEGCPHCGGAAAHWKDE